MSASSAGWNSATVCLLFEVVVDFWTNYIHFNREWAQCLGMIALIKQNASSCCYGDPGWDSSSSLSHTLWVHVHPNFLFLSFPFLVVPLGMCSLLSLPFTPTHLLRQLQIMPYFCGCTMLAGVLASLRGQGGAVLL